MSARKDEPPSGDRRVHMRFPITFRAIANWSRHFAFVQIADIANGGLRLIGDSLPVEGTHVRIGARSLDTDGQVIWRTPHSCGVMLSRPIDALRVVRANCKPGIQQALGDAPLSTIRAGDLADRLDAMFESRERAQAFVRWTGLQKSP